MSEALEDINFMRGERFRRSLKDFDEMDAWPKAMRECVQEFGIAIVRACRQAGVKEPRHIRMLVREIWAGARTPYETHRKDPLSNLDWVLIQNGCPVSALSFMRLLEHSNYLVVPREPNTPMVNASMAALDGHGWVSKSTKHRLRLAAANKLGAERLRREASDE